MNRIALQKVLWKYGYNVLPDKKEGERRLKDRGVNPMPVSIYLKNGYVVHIKPENEPVFDFIDLNLADITLTISGIRRSVVFDCEEVATIQIRKDGFVVA